MRVRLPGSAPGPEQPSICKLPSGKRVWSGLAKRTRAALYYLGSRKTNDKSVMGLLGSLLLGVVNSWPTSLVYREGVCDWLRYETATIITNGSRAGIVLVTNKDTGTPKMAIVVAEGDGAPGAREALDYPDFVEAYREWRRELRLRLGY